MTGSAESGEAASGNPLWWLFRRYGMPHRRLFGIGLLTQALGRFPEKLPPLLIGIAIDAIFLNTGPFRLPLVPEAWLPTTTVGQFLLTLGILALAYPADAFFDFVSTRTLGTFGQRFQHDVRTDVFDTVQHLTVGFFDDSETGDVMSILNDDVRELNAFVFGTLSTAIRMSTFALVSYVYLVWLNWQLATVLFVLPVVLLGISYWFSSVMEPKHLAIRERVGELNSRLNNNIGGIAVIKASGTESLERRRVEQASAAHRDAQWDAHRAQEAAEPGMRAISQTTKMVTLLVGGYWVLRGAPPPFSGTLTAGALYTFYSMVGGFVEPMRQLAGVVDSYQNGKAAASRVRGVVEREAIAEQPDADPLVDPDGRVTYEDVSFSYPGREEATLDAVSFDADPGETIGVVGPTGAGKSTLLKLLLRFYDPDDGAVRVDGRDVRDVTVESLRESIGYISQDPFLFHGTVRENIAYACTDVSDEAVSEAAKLAGAHEFVSDLPDGYDTQVGERGVKLSGGQRQRIAIARAIVRDPEILVLDEATSHVDNETEVLIQRALDELAADRTTFVIAHRLSTVRDADAILVIDDGRLVEQGTHEELLAAGGLYANLWGVQVGDVDALPDRFLDRVRTQEGST